MLLLFLASFYTLSFIFKSMYGLILVTSLIFCAFLAQRTVVPENKDLFWKLVFYMLIFGVIGARIYHVIHFADYYTETPILILKIWQGGLGIIGGLFGALFALVMVLVQEKKIHASLYWLDIFAFFAPLAKLLDDLAISQIKSFSPLHFMRASDRQLSFSSF